MADPAAASVPTPAKEKKKSKRRFPSIKSFKSKTEYFDHMIKFFQDKKADYLKFGDTDKKKTADKAKKFVAGLDEMLKDPAYSELIMEIRKKVQTPSIPGKGK